VPSARSAAWAGLLAEQSRAPAAAPSVLPARAPLARAREEYRQVREGVAASLAAAERSPMAGPVREWLSCVDELLAVAERLYAHAVVVAEP
jgi:hypothetical protein